MSATADSLASTHATRAWRYIAAAGVVVGFLDIAYACLFWAIRNGTPPSRIFQSVAAGLLGSAAFTGGAATAALGLLLHFGIATTIAFTYVLASRAWPPLWQRPWRFGPAYGLAVYIVMNHVVVPLSAASRGSTDVMWITLTLAVHAMFVGVPCALAARAAWTPA